MKTIRLTRGKVAKVDDSDYKFLSKWNWYTKTTRSEGKISMYYAARFERRRTSGRLPSKGVTIYMHRVVAKCPKDKEVHHKNGDGLDNRRRNLKVTTKIENLSYRKS